jgi:Zn-dependent protease/CBS domain-containing protein
MGSSLRIARIAGIDVRVHVTFFLLLAWIGWSSWSVEGTLAAALAGVGFVLLVFAIVVLHELGHALVARRYGVRTQDITLLPIGGVARLDRIPEEPRAELLIALAGPAVNVALAIGLGTLAWTIGESPFAADPTASDLPLLTRLFWLNLVLAGFNLIPAFPMDGGRALRALLSWRMDRMRATVLAAGLGRTLAIAFGLIGLLWNPLLAFIALFVWFGAKGEAEMAQLETSIRGLRVGDAMVRHFEVLTPDDTLATACGHVLGGFQTDFPVVDDGRVVGVLGNAELIRGLAERGPESAVGAAMLRDFCTAEVGESLIDVLRRMETKAGGAVPVLAAGQPVGVLTLAGLGELVAIRSASRLANARQPTPKTLAAAQRA